MPLQNIPNRQIKIAIIGGGPAGLGAAIEFGKLPFVDWRLYEQAESIREIGAGISIQQSTWRMLEVMGAAGNLKDFYRPADNHSVQHRNGRTGELLLSLEQPGIPHHQLHARTHRAKLQNALLEASDQSRIRLSSRLVKVEQNPSGKLLIEFEDGFKDEVDLLVGADGVRSVVRNFAFPSHRISYTGRTSYRVVVTSDEIATVPGIPEAVTFWHGPLGWVYTCPLGDNKFEITTNTLEPDVQGERAKVSWGEDATLEQNARHFEGWVPTITKLLVLPKEIKQYALFAGPRLESVISHGSVALVGDASHPLSGAFGAGAGFALEDVFVLARGIEWAHEHNLTLQDGLNLFDKVRGPHYKRLYGLLDKFAETDALLQKSDVGFDEKVNIILDGKWNNKYSWIAQYDVQQVLKDAILQENIDRLAMRETARL